MDKEYIRLFEEYIEKVRETYQVQGLIVGIFDKEKVLYKHIVGYRDSVSKKSINEDTIFGVASITKSFTVIRLLQLVDKGIIDLDAPVSLYYEDWRLSAEHTPTIKQLLSHAGGFYPQERFLMNDFASKLNLEDMSSLAHSQKLQEEGISAIVKRLNQVEFFNGLPGMRFSYSNFSFGILTDLVRRYSPEKDYVTSMNTGVLQPMGFKNTFFDFKRTCEEENIATLYTPGELGVKATSDYTDLGFVLLGGGGLKSTFNELMRYTRLYMNEGKLNGQEILSKYWVDEMVTERISYKEHQGYGYGLVTGKLDGFDYAGHGGGLTGVSSFFGFSKDGEKGVVVLCNTSGVPASSIGIAALRLAHDQYPDYKVGQYATGLWSKDTIDNTLGFYESEEGDKVEIQACGDGVKAIIDGKELTCRLIDDDLMLIQNKMEENYCKILRRKNGKSFGLYLGSRIIPKKI